MALNRTSIAYRVEGGKTILGLWSRLYLDEEFWEMNNQIGRTMGLHKLCINIAGLHKLFIWPSGCRICQVH